MDVTTGRPVGVEALVRWQHPVRGLLGPLEYVELAERTELILPLGAWVLHEACRIAVCLQSRSAGAFAVAVNLSARQVSDRARRPDRRGVLADVRDEISTDRDADVDRLLALADKPDAAAEQRDRAAEQRDAETDKHEEQTGTNDPAPGNDRRHAAIDRPASDRAELMAFAARGTENGPRPVDPLTAATPPLRAAMTPHGQHGRQGRPHRERHGPPASRR